MSVFTETQQGQSPAVIDVDERSFQQAVIERSHSVPVVVDLWAPWCGPCRTLGPILEKIANEAQGAFVLAKVNVDENPRIAQAFRVQGIPAVKAIVNGRLIDEFAGALPESQVRAWLQRFVQFPETTADNLLEAAAALEVSNPQEAAARYRVALGDNPENTAAMLGLGRLLVLQGEPEGAATLSQIPRNDPHYNQAQGWLALANFMSEADQPQPEDNPLAARYWQAAHAVRAQDFSTAIEELLAIIMRDRSFRDDAARKTLLSLFDALGNDHPLVAPSRRKLANLLF